MGYSLRKGDLRAIAFLLSAIARHYSCGFEMGATPWCARSQGLSSFTSASGLRLLPDISHTWRRFAVMKIPRRGCCQQWGWRKPGFADLVVAWKCVFIWLHDDDVAKQKRGGAGSNDTPVDIT